MLTTVNGSGLPCSAAASLQLIRDPCGSQSTASVRPSRCRTMARLTADVVLPVPPFEETRPSLIRGSPSPVPGRIVAQLMSGSPETGLIGQVPRHQQARFRGISRLGSATFADPGSAASSGSGNPVGKKLYTQ